MQNNQNIKILIIDDEAPIREILSASLRDEGYTVSSAQDGDSGLKAIAEFSPDIVFLDIWMPGTKDGIEVLKIGRAEFPQVDFVMMSGHGTIETAVKATKLGAWDFIEKPLSMDKIFINIANIVSIQQQKIEKQALLNKLRKNIAIIGESAKMIEVKKIIAQTAPTHQAVLLWGENGAGKELAAQNIHYLSERAFKPFVDINCAAVPEDLIEAELFGYEKGAYPGADKTRKGKVELAQGGTLFIDDISELNLKAQELLLKILKEQKFSRMGGQEVLTSDVRIVAATTKNLADMVKAQKFHPELFFKLSTLTLKAPPLREHNDDVPALVKHFSDQFAREGGYLRKDFSKAAIETLHKYPWPGNVRELRNFMERIYILTPGEFVDVHDLHFAGLKSGDEAGTQASTTDYFMSDFRDARAHFEKEYLLKKLEENNGNISRTAEVIGLERSYLHRKIKSYGIEVN